MAIMSDGESLIVMAISLGLFSVSIALSFMIKYLTDIRDELRKIAERL